MIHCKVHSFPRHRNASIFLGKRSVKHCTSTNSSKYGNFESLPLDFITPRLQAISCALLEIIHNPAIEDRSPKKFRHPITDERMLIERWKNRMPEAPTPCINSLSLRGRCCCCCCCFEATQLSAFGGHQLHHHCRATSIIINSSELLRKIPSISPRQRFLYERVG